MLSITLLSTLHLYCIHSLGHLEVPETYPLNVKEWQFRGIRNYYQHSRRGSLVLEDVVKKKRLFQVDKCVSQIMKMIINWSEKRYILNRNLLSDIVDYKAGRHMNLGCEDIDARERRILQEFLCEVIGTKTNIDKMGKEGNVAELETTWINYWRIHHFHLSHACELDYSGFIFSNSKLNLSFLYNHDPNLGRFYQC